MSHLGNFDEMAQYLCSDFQCLSRQYLPHCPETDLREENRVSELTESHNAPLWLSLQNKSLDLKKKIKTTWMQKNNNKKNNRSQQQ